MISDWFFIYLFSLLQFSLCSSILLPSSVSIHMTISCNSLSGKLLLSISLGLFPLGIFFSCFFIWNIFLYLLILFDFFACFYELEKTATSPNFEGVVLCRNDFCGDYSRWLWQAGWSCSRHIQCQGCPSRPTGWSWAGLDAPGCKALRCHNKLGWSGREQV